MLIRREQPGDRDAVRAVHAAAFARAGVEVPEEVGLLDELVAGGDTLPRLCLVAEVEGAVVGHVACSRAFVDATPVVALGPIGVRPAGQGRGAGSALVHAALGGADALDEALVGLLGSPAYYGRFGFVPAAPGGIEAPDAAWGDHFQVRRLAADPGVRGRFRYPAAFGV